jgi:putative membrane protein insertion efficiency factor
MIKLWNATVGRLLVAALTGLIRIYQLTISPLLGPVCRYYPSCSHYSLEAIRVHRAAKGVLLTGWRLLRCHPWARGGVDPVPPRGQWPARLAAATPDSLASEPSRTGAPS